jgi:hypothetical protein
MIESNHSALAVYHRAPSMTCSLDRFAEGTSHSSQGGLSTETAATLCPARVEVLPPLRLPGGPLTESDLDKLQSSFISPDAAQRAQLRRVDSAQGRQCLGRKDTGDYSGILFPNIRPGDSRPREYRLRRDNPDLEYDTETGKTKERKKYLSPPGRGNLAYFPPGIPASRLADPKIPAFVTEGEKKCLALDELFRREGAEALVVGLSGVWNFRGTVGKASGPNGERQDVKGVITDLDTIMWKGRTVVIVFDSNASTNPSVNAARRYLAWELKRRGAEVRLVDIPPEDGVNGVDDLLGLHGPKHVMALLAQAMPIEKHLRVGGYQATDLGLQWIEKKDGAESIHALTNFTAFIVGEGILDDGLEQVRYYEIEATVRGRCVHFKVPAADFDSMSWVAEKLGAEACIFVGRYTKEHVRVAIRQLSGHIPLVHTYSHTGWREVDGVPTYLHKAGGICSAGTRHDVSVSLPQSLCNYELPDPPEGKALMTAVQASLSCWDLAPDRIGIPLHAAIYRAPLGDSDLSMFLSGHTGTGKSELAARCQQHYGAQMDRKRLPANWNSTPNAIESLSHSAKDALMTIDDFVPQGSTHDIARTHKDADRVMRGQGNQAGRQRMRADGSDSPGRHPRGLIVSTGEDVPRGQSLASRMVIISVSPNDVDWDRMTCAQQDGHNGLFAAAMAAYLKWLASRYEVVRSRLPEMIERYRTAASNATGHRHTPENIANLAVGIHYFLEFAVESGIIISTERDALWERGWTALCDAGRAQVLHQEANDPTDQFIAYLRSAITSGHAFVAATDGCAPPMAVAWGWRTESSGLEPRGDLIGWIDGDDLYLQPESAYCVTQRMVREANGSLALGPAAVWKRLNERGLLVNTDKKRGTFKVRKTINKTGKNVLHLLASTITPSGDDDVVGSVGRPPVQPTTVSAERKEPPDEMSVLSVYSNNNDPTLGQEELFG